MTEAEQALADLVERFAREHEYYEGKGLGSPIMLVNDIDVWMQTYYPDEFQRLKEEAAQLQDDEEDD